MVISMYRDRANRDLALIRDSINIPIWDRLGLLHPKSLHGCVLEISNIYIFICIILALYLYIRD